MVMAAAGASVVVASTSGMSAPSASMPGVRRPAQAGYDDNAPHPHLRRTQSTHNFLAGTESRQAAGREASPTIGDRGGRASANSRSRYIVPRRPRDSRSWSDKTVMSENPQPLMPVPAAELAQPEASLAEQTLRWQDHTPARLWTGRAGVSYRTGTAL